MNESIPEINQTHDQGNRTLLHILIIVQSIIVAPIVVCNILIIAAPVYTKRLRTPDNLLMVNLAIADLITGLYNGHIDLLATFPDDYLGIRTNWLHCYLFLFGHSFSFRVSLYTVCLMSIDKFLAITFPFKYIVYFDMKMATTMIISVWSFTCLNSAVSFAFFRYDSDSVQDHRCRYANCFTNTWRLYDSGCVGVTIIIIWVLTLILLRQVRAMRHEDKKLVSHIVVNSIYKAKYDNDAGVDTNMFLISINSILLLAPAITVFTGNTPSYDTTLHMVLAWRLPLCVNAVLNVFVFAYFRSLNRAAYHFLMSNPPWKWKRLNASLRRICYEQAGGRATPLLARQKRTMKLKSMITRGEIDQIEESSSGAGDSPADLAADMFPSLGYLCSPSTATVHVLNPVGSHTSGMSSSKPNVDNTFWVNDLSSPGEIDHNPQKSFGVMLKQTYSKASIWNT